MSAKLSLVAYVPPMPDPASVVPHEPELTPAVVGMLFGNIFLGMYQSPDYAPYFASVNNETAVRGIVAMDQALLVEVAIAKFREKNSRSIVEKDYAKVSKGLNVWMKAAEMSRTVRRSVAKEAALAALPAAAE